METKKTSYRFDDKLPVDDRGYYGEFGGAYVPDELKARLAEVDAAFSEAIAAPGFRRQFEQLMRDYVGRPTPLYPATALSRRFGAKIYLKREDLNHTGAHKINNAIGLGLLAKRMGKKRIIAETGAGQHGVAAATVATLLGLECTVFMGATDIRRQKPNVERMRMLGAEVKAATEGNSTLNNAVDAAFAEWLNDPEAFYLIGSAVGPHPFPSIVARFQSIISEEMRAQLLEHEGRETPDYVVAAIGGGSNAAGAFYYFLDEPQVNLIAVEAAGKGIDTDLNAATLTVGHTGVLHGAKTKITTDANGKLREAYSISAGLDYPGIGPLQAMLAAEGRSRVIAVTDREALAAARMLAREEGIIPAIESAHAVAAISRLPLKPDDVVVVNVSGRGDKDMEAFMNDAGDAH